MIKSRRLRWAGHVARMEEGRSAFEILTNNNIEKRPIGRPRHRWEDNIGMDLNGIGVNMRNWTNSTSPCKCSIGPPGSISHGVSQLV